MRLSEPMSRYDVTYIVLRRKAIKSILNVMIPKALIAASIKPFILSILSRGPSYGYEIINSVETLTSGDVAWTTSTLYPVLHRLENEGMLESFWKEMEKGPARKYYKLTPKGVRSLELQKQQWLSVHAALTSLWDASPGLSPA